MWTVTLAMDTQLPADYVQNQFCTGGPGGDDTAISDELIDFYDSLVASVFPTTVAQNGHIIKRYDLPGTPPNYPTFERSFNLATNPAGTALPAEVALCLSFQAERVPGQFQARKRGRIYLGPLEIGMNADGRPTQGEFAGILNAAEALYDGIAGITDAGEWSVWSPTDGVAYPLVEAWIDNAFDTQRSRGIDPSLRVTRSFL